MPLRIDTVLGMNAAVFDDLLEISRCDPGLSAFDATPFVLEVTYSQKQLGVPPSNRLLAVNNLSEYILIIGVDSTYVVNGLPITSAAGVTIQAYLAQPITIYMDMTEAAGQGYFVLNRNGGTIKMPRPVLLYHELAHAYHGAIGDLPDIPADAEVQAQKDENEFRSFLGLPLRSSVNHSGGVGTVVVGPEFPRCAEPKSTWGLNCIVASAAYEDRWAIDADSLRLARRHYAGLNGWTMAVAAPMLAAYSAFSPPVTRAMNEDSRLRRAVAAFAVKPLVEVLALVDAFLAADASEPDLEDALDRSRTRYAAFLAERRLGGSDLDAARRSLARVLDAPDWHGLGRATNAAPEADDLFAFVAGEIAATGTDTAPFVWVLGGIKAYLDAAAAPADDESAAGRFVDRFGRWVVRLPVPPGQALEGLVASDQLEDVGRTLVKRAAARLHFARYVEEQLGGDAVERLRHVLDAFAADADDAVAEPRGPHAH